MRTINGFFPDGPVLNLDMAGGGGASQMSVSVAKSRKESIGFTRLSRRDGRCGRLQPSAI